MGSPLSTIIANLYMESFERKALASTPLTPTLWLRYVDDTFTLWPHGQEQLEEFHNHLNKQHPQIQFTREKESNNHISFLDVLVTKKDGAFETTVYRKPTHTNRYMHFSSHHHPRVKSGTIKCLVKRAEMICDNKKKKEMTHIRNTLKRMGTRNISSREVSRHIPDNEPHHPRWRATT